MYKRNLNKLEHSEQDHIGRITMCFNENLNAIDEELAEELLYMLDQYEKNDDVNVIVLSSKGKVFSSGGDIRYFYDLLKRDGKVDLSGLANLVGKLAYAMRSHKKMIITAVTGTAAGAGANLALNGDFVVCSQEASFFAGICISWIVSGYRRYIYSFTNVRCTKNNGVLCTWRGNYGG